MHSPSVNSVCPANGLILTFCPVAGTFKFPCSCPSCGRMAPPSFIAFIALEGFAFSLDDTKKKKDQSI